MGGLRRVRGHVKRPAVWLALRFCGGLFFCLPIYFGIISKNGILFCNSFQIFSEPLVHRRQTCYYDGISLRVRKAEVFVTRLKYFPGGKNVMKKNMKRTLLAFTVMAMLASSMAVPAMADATPPGGYGGNGSL